MIVYIINIRVTRKKLDDRSKLGHFMGYTATIEVIIYWKTDQPFVIHTAHHVWFDEYNSSRYIEDKNTPVSFLLQHDPEINDHNPDLLNLITCDLDLAYTPFRDTKILTYEIELPPSGNKVGFNLLENEDVTIPYITDTIPNSPECHQLPIQAKQNVWIIAINGEEPITDKGELDELNHHQNTH